MRRPHGISFESSASLLQKCRRHRQVFLGRAEIDMSQVGRQFWQQLCDVCSCFVGRDQAVDTEGMPKIVETRLVTSTVFASDSRIFAKLTERMLNRVNRQPISLSPDKEWSTRHRRVAGFASDLCELSHRLLQVRSNGHKSGLVKLTLSNQ